MALNIFEIISVTGTPGVEVTFVFNDEELLLNNYEPIFTTYSLINVNLKPVGWEAYNFSDLDGMGGGITLTQLVNNEFGNTDGSSWIFDTVSSITIGNDFIDQTLHKSFARIEGWEITMHSIDNDGMDDGNNTKIENDTTPGNNYAKGNFILYCI
jgi:hypothetical protein